MSDDNLLNEETESDTVTPKISPLSDRPWPNFPDENGVSLSTANAESLYRSAMGINSLVRILQRSNRLRDNIETYDGETDYPLSEYDEGNLWSALTVLGENLTRIVEEMYEQALAEMETAPLP